MWHNSYFCDLLEENLLSLNNQLLISFQIACSQEPPVIPTHLCPGLQDLTARCLQLIPDSRPQARELVHHPVFAELFHWWSHTVLFYTTTYLLTYLFMVTHVQNVLLIHYCINYLCTGYSFWDRLRNFFITNLDELFCQFISWTNWVNSGKFMDNCWISSYGWYEKSLWRSHNY